MNWMRWTKTMGWSGAALAAALGAFAQDRPGAGQPGAVELVPVMGALQRTVPLPMHRHSFESPFVLHPLATLRTALPFGYCPIPRL